MIRIGKEEADEFGATHDLAKRNCPVRRNRKFLTTQPSEHARRGTDIVTREQTGAIGEAVSMVRLSS